MKNDKPVFEKVTESIIIPSGWSINVPDDTIELFKISHEVFEPPYVFDQDKFDQSLKDAESLDTRSIMQKVIDKNMGRP